MKKNVSRPLAMAILTILLLTLPFAPAVLAEEVSESPDQPLPEEKYTLMMDFDLKSNVMLARYGVTVYVDETKAGFLDQGGRLIKIMEMNPGIHTIRICPEQYGVTEMSFDFRVSSDTTLISTLQTHLKYIKINALTFSLPQREIKFREMNCSWNDFIPLLLYSVLNCI